MSFDSVPIIDLALARDPKSKPVFLSSLRDALLKVGFFYIKNIGVSDDLIQDVISHGKAFFDLPHEEKLKVQMKNVSSFLGTSVMLLFFAPHFLVPSLLPVVLSIMGVKTDIFQATTPSAQRPQQMRETTENRSTSPRPIRFPPRPPLSTTTSSLPISGRLRLSSRPSALYTKPTSPKCLRYQQPSHL